MADKSDTIAQRETLDWLQAEVESLKQQLRHAQRLATVGTMTAIVAHEFNNILTPIVNYAQMARQNPKFAGKAIDKAADGGERAAEICKALMGMTHNGQSPTQVRLAEMVEQSLTAMARDPAKDGIELLVDVPSDMTIKAKSGELQQVLVNLIINARAAVLAKGGNGKRITITGRRNGIAELCVSDTGTGIAPEHLDKVFQPFFTTKSPTSEGQGGNGLGLFICNDIVTQMGGTISVRSEIGKGATFTVRLP